MESAGEYVRRYQSSSTAARLSASVSASSMCLMASCLALSSYNSVRARSRSTTASLACVLAFCASSRTRIAPLPFRRNLIVHCTLLAAAEGAFTLRGCLYSPSFREGFFSETGFPAHTILGNSEGMRSSRNPASGIANSRKNVFQERPSVSCLRLYETERTGKLLTQVHSRYWKSPERE